MLSSTLWMRWRAAGSSCRDTEFRVTSLAWKREGDATRSKEMPGAAETLGDSPPPAIPPADAPAPEGEKRIGGTAQSPLDGIAPPLRKWGLPWTRFPALSAIPAPVPPPVGLLTVPIRAPARSASAPRRLGIVTRSRARTPRCRSGVWPGLTRRPRWNSYSSPKIMRST